MELRSGNLLDSSGICAIEPTGEPRRGCQLRVPDTGEAVLHVPARSLLAHQPQIVASFRLNVPRAHDPLWQKIPWPLDSAESTDGGSLGTAAQVIERVRHALDSDVPIVWSKQSPSSPVVLNAEQGWALAHCGDHRELSPCDVAEPAVGLAVDLGTTTVVVALVDLASGEILADASALNAQTRLGDNVLTRINLCMTQPRLVRRLQQAVVRHTLVPLVSEVTRRAEVLPRQLKCMVVAGNTTMLHLLLGVDPTSLGTAPFTPVFLEHRIVPAAELSLQIRLDGCQQNVVAASADDLQLDESADGPGESAPCPAAPTQAGQTFVPRMSVHLLPGSAAYVGADITAGVLAERHGLSRGYLSAG